MANLLATVGSVYQDPLLTDVSVRYSNKSLIAEQVFPIVNVPRRTGVYFVYDKANLRSPQSSVRTDLSRANRVKFAMTKTAYGPLLEHALEAGVPKDEADEQDAPLDLKIDATITVTDKILVEKELALAVFMNSTSNITNNTTKSGTSQWSDFTNSTPFVDIQSARTGMMQNTVVPNAFVMGQYVWDQLKNHPDLLDRVKYTQLASLTTEILATLFEVSTVLIGNGAYNNSNEGASDSMTYIWPKSAWLMYITPTPGIRQVTGGYTLTLAGGRYVDTWDEQDKKATFVRYNDYYIQKVIAQEAMYLIKNAVA